MNMELDWKVPGDNTSERAIEIAFAITTIGRKLIAEKFSDMEEIFPFNRNFHFHAHFDPDGWFGLRLVFLLSAVGMVVGPKMNDNEVAYLKGCIEPYEAREPERLFVLLGKDWFSLDRFTYVGPYESTYVSWADIQAHLLYWLNHVVLPGVLEKNRIRVLRAIPAPPKYDILPIQKALWVLECDIEQIQGTAFALEGTGLVTCSHVLGKATHAFRYDQPERKYPITILVQHSTVDLAILTNPEPSQNTLKRGDPSVVQQMDHVLVAGHPNYRHGDSPFIVPGMIVGFRMHSGGIRRLVTNAAIVAGCSGGPVIDQYGRVVGVAVTGAERFAEAQNTEDHGIIPIDTLDLIMTY